MPRATPDGVTLAESTEVVKDRVPREPGNFGGVTVPSLNPRRTPGWVIMALRGKEVRQ